MSRRDCGFAWSPCGSHDLVVRGSAGLFFDRVPLRAVANAILSAGNTTDLANLHQPSVSGHHSDAGRRSGVPEHPARAPADDHARGLHDDGPEPAERVLEAGQHRGGARRLREGLTVSVGYQYLRGEQPADVGQPERADLRGRGHEQRLPSERGVSEQQPVFVGRRLDLSRAAPVVRAAPDARGRACASPTRSRSR